VRVVVLGAGSLGSLYGAWAAEAGHEVVLVTRTAHAAAIADHGLTVRNRDGVVQTVAVEALDDARAAPDADVVLLACKGHDTARLLEAYGGRAGAAWSVQNGALQSEVLVRRFGSAAIGCASMVGATLAEPGIVHHTFSGRTYLGALPSSAPSALGEVCRSLAAAPDVVERDDIESVLWSKAVLATGAMGVSVLLRVAYHCVFVEPIARGLFYDVVSDAAEVAAAVGVSLTDLPGPLQVGSLMHLAREEALQRLAAVGQAMVAAGETHVRVSMLQSVETGRRLEVDAVFGDLIAVADRHSLAIPMLRAVTRIVEAIDALAQSPLTRTEHQ
jgi:2-dehydropantoate 2-reductase